MNEEIKKDLTEEEKKEVNNAIEKIVKEGKEEENYVIGYVDKGNNGKSRTSVSLYDYKGINYVVLNNQFFVKDENKFAFSKKSISIEHKYIDKVIELLKKAKDCLDFKVANQ